MPLLPFPLVLSLLKWLRETLKQKRAPVADGITPETHRIATSAEQDLSVTYWINKKSITLLTKAVYFHQEINQIEVEQISFILLENTLISFQEKAGDHFDPVRERIRNKLLFTVYQLKFY